MANLHGAHTSSALPQQAMGVLTPGRLGDHDLPTSRMTKLSIASEATPTSTATSANPKSASNAAIASPQPSAPATGTSATVLTSTTTGHTPGSSDSMATVPADDKHHRKHHLGFLHRSHGAHKDISDIGDVGDKGQGGNQTASGDHVLPGMEDIGAGYSGTAAASGIAAVPTGHLPPGTIEKGATNYAIPRPSAKDFFHMSNSHHPARPHDLAHRPVHQDPISEADHIAPSHGGHMGNPGNMTSSFPSTWAEPVDPYMAGAHGDHLVRGVNVGPGYAGTAAANGDIHAPTGSLPAGITELGATDRALPRPSPKDFFKMSNASHPSSPRALAHRPVVTDPLGHGTDVNNQ